MSTISWSQLYSMSKRLCVQSALCPVVLFGFHDDVIKWKYFPCYWPFARGIHRWIPLTKASDAERWSVSSSLPFILQSPKINFVWYDMSNTPQLESSWRWPLWSYRSPQDVSAGHGRCHGDNPWKFRNDVIVWGTEIVLRSIKCIGNEKESWA